MTTQTEIAEKAAVGAAGQEVPVEGRGMSSGAPGVIAYLANQYPKVSHAFVRREICELEAQGIKVLRYSIRPCPDRLVDPADERELERTKVLLAAGGAALIGAMLAVAMVRPQRFGQALLLAIRNGWRSDRGLARNLIYLMEACLLLRWLGREGVIHLHAHFGTNSAAVAMLCRVLGGPTYSFTVHGPEEFDKATLLGLEEKIKRSTFVVAISEFTRSQLFRWCSNDQWSKIRVVRCGVDQSFLQEPATPIGPDGRLVCVGRLCEQKGQLLLIEAAKRLADEGLAFEIVLVGDGEMRDAVESAIDRYGLRDHCRVTGWVNAAAIREYLRSARAMVLPSFAEGLPVVIMEAMAMGRPVISTYVAGINELVEPGVSGWLVAAGSLEPLVEAMREALAAPAHRLEEMGRAGAERTRRRHDISCEVSKLTALLNNGQGTSCTTALSRV